MSLLSDFKKWMNLQKKEIELQSLAIGINSTVDFTKDLHIVMLDYDIQDLVLVEESVMEIQLYWHAGDAHIIKTKNGYHAYFFNTIVPYGRLKMIIEYARYVDPMYKFISRYYDHKTIRVAGKYKEKDLSFVKVIKSIYRISDRYNELGDLKKREFEQLSKVALA